MDVSDRISFDELPPDVVRMIIRKTGAPFRMRLISHTWNALACEYLNSTSSRILPLPEVHLSVNKNDTLSIHVLLPEQHLDHFGIDMWSRAYSTTQNVWASSSSQRVFLKNEFESTAEVDFTRQRLRILFESCSSIGKLSIHNVDSSTFAVICHCLGSVQIDEVSVRTTNSGLESKAEIVEMAKHLDVKEITTVNGHIIDGFIRR